MLGEPGQGRTTMALHWALALARGGRPVRVVCIFASNSDQTGAISAHFASSDTLRGLCCSVESHG